MCLLEGWTPFLLHLVLEMPPMSRIALLGLLMGILYILTLDARIDVGVPVYGDVDFGHCSASIRLLTVVFPCIVVGTWIPG